MYGGEHGQQVRQVCQAGGEVCRDGGQVQDLTVQLSLCQVDCGDTHF